jgi:hypothetical protein
VESQRLEAGLGAGLLVTGRSSIAGSKGSGHDNSTGYARLRVLMTVFRPDTG